MARCAIRVMSFLAFWTRIGMHCLLRWNAVECTGSPAHTVKFTPVLCGCFHAAGRDSIKEESREEVQGRTCFMQQGRVWSMITDGHSRDTPFPWTSCSTRPQIWDVFVCMMYHTSIQRKSAHHHKHSGAALDDALTCVRCGMYLLDWG